jgi:hypothetical protein
MDALGYIGSNLGGANNSTRKTLIGDTLLAAHLKVAMLPNAGGVINFIRLAGLLWDRSWHDSTVHNANIRWAPILRCRCINVGVNLLAMLPMCC